MPYSMIKVLMIHALMISLVFNKGPELDLCHLLILCVDLDKSERLALMAQSDACQICDLEVPGSIPNRSSNILSWGLIVKYFLWSFSPFG